MRVPDRITSPVRKLCNRLSSVGDPAYVPVQVESYAVINECFPAVKQKIERDGGAVQYGWVIWFTPGVLMEAEFHAVLKSPNGQFIDIARRPFKFERILFLPDKRRVYQGRQIDNLRIPLKKNPKVRRFIELAEQNFKVMNEGDLANKHGVIKVDEKKLRPIMEEMATLSTALGLIETDGETDGV